MADDHRKHKRILKIKTKNDLLRINTMKYFENIKRYFLKARKNILIGISVFIFILGLINIYYVVDVTALSNDECLWVDKKIHVVNNEPVSTIFFEKVKVDGITWNAGIRDGDVFISLNGHKLKNSMDASKILNSQKSGESAKYVYERNGKQFETDIKIKKLILLPNLAICLISFFWFLVGFVVILAKPEGKVQRHFFYIGVVSVVFMASVPYNYLYLNGILPQNLLTAIFGISTLWASLTLPFLILTFFLIFPEPYKFYERKFIKYFFRFLPVIIVTLIVAFQIIGRTQDYNSMIERGKLITSLILLLLFVSFSVSLVILIISYFRLKTPERKKPVLFIVISYFLGFLSLIYTFVFAPSIGTTLFNNPEFYSPIILLILLPISFGVSIFKYQLMDVSVLVRNTVVYLTATVTLLGSYFLLIYLLGQGIATVIGTSYQGIIAGIVFIIFALIFQSTKDKFQELLTKRFYPEQFAYQQILIRFSNDIPGIIGINNILSSMQTIFVDNLRLDRFGIFLFDNENKNLKLDNCLGIDCSSLNSEANYRLISNFINEKRLTNKYAIIDQTEFGNVFSEEDKNILIDSRVFTILPLFYKEKLIGLILLGLKASGSQFIGKDLELLSAIANQIAIAIENARLYELDIQRKTVERDLETARNIQQNLLPKDLPVFDGIDISGMMIPAQQVGGDYYDILKISESRFFIIIGDVSGKGLSAALYMTSLQAMMQIFCTKSLSPSEILIEINKKLYHSLEKNSFITLSIALFDTEEKTIRFCRAGHTPLIVKSKEKVEFLMPKGIGLGLESGSIFEKSIEEVTIKLSEDTHYLFFSDGVSEAMDEKNDLFGEDRILGVLKNLNGSHAKDSIDKIINEINIFKNNREQNDDISIVLVKTNKFTNR